MTTGSTKPSITAERIRLAETDAGIAAWDRWGPYVAERQLEPRLEERLHGWFASEVRRADRDLAASPLARPVVGSRTRVARPVTLAGIAAAVAVVAILVSAPPAIAPIGDRDHDPLHPSTAPSTPDPEEPPFVDGNVTAWYADGVPSSIAGEPVFRPAEALPAVNAGTFHGLIGGWSRIDSVVDSCLAQIPAPGATADPHFCDLLGLSESPSGVSTISLQPPIGFNATSAIAVIRVEALDIRPTLLATVDPSFLATRSLDGIPTAIDGRTVLRASELPRVVRRAIDDTPFFVGGWYTSPHERCAFNVETPHPLEPTCNVESLADVLGDSGMRVVAETNVPVGPVVLRVHVRDPRAITCANPATCANTVIVEAVEWSGDSWTATEPLTILDVVERLRAVLTHVPFTSFEPLGRDPEHRCDGGVPPQTWEVTGDIRIGRVLVYATTAERQRFDYLLGASGLSTRNLDGTRCSIIVDSAFASKWVAVDNILVEVRVAFGSNKADAAFVAIVTQALRGKAPP